MRRSSAQTYSLAAGVLLTLVGATGFAVSGDFSSGHAVIGAHHHGVGLFEDNGWQNVLRLVTGVAGLLAARTLGGARAYALLAGTLYAVLTVGGLVAGSSGVVFGLFPVNAANDILNVLVALFGLAVWFGGSSTPAPTMHGGEEGSGFRFD